MRRLKKAGSRSGFTLVELIVSIAIFGVLMVAFLSVFLAGFGLTLRAGNTDRTVAEISGKVEKSMASDAYTDADVTSSTATVTVTFGGGTSEDVAVDKTTGTSQTEDGKTVVIESYETAVSP